MPIASVPTYGLLDEWRQYTGIDVWFFNQAAGAGAPIERAAEVWTIRDRDVLARTFNRSFWTAARYLGYPIVPVFIPRAERIPLSKGIPYHRQQLQTKFGWIQDFGVRATELIQAGVTVTYTDDDGDTIDDLATVTVTTTVAASEIKLFFRTADGAPSAAHELWEVEPTVVSKAGNIATIEAHRALFVKPSIVKQPYNDPNYVPEDKNMADTQVAANFVTAVDVYRVYNDTTSAVKLISDPALSGDTTTTAFTETDTSPLIIDRELGTFSVRQSTTPCPSPEFVDVYYRAGLPRVGGQADWELLEAVARLTHANMPQRLDSIRDPVVNVWSEDRDPELNIPSYLDNPFGALRGQVAAWRIVESRALGRGGRVTMSRRFR